MNELEKYIKNNKLIVPEDEIDNIYIWTKVSNTQEVLLSSNKYYQLINTSFLNEITPMINVLNEKISGIKSNSYTLADYITFNLNKNIIFNKNSCFCYMTSTDLLNSLICYIAHTQNKYLIYEDSIASLIINKIDESERFTSLLDKDFIVLRDFANLPDHKYKSAILDSIILRRCKQDKVTLALLARKEILIGKNIIDESRVKDKNIVDLQKMYSAFISRRSSSYKALLSEWFSMMPLNLEQFIYSKEEPVYKIRKVSRYK